MSQQTTDVDVDARVRSLADAIRESEQYQQFAESQSKLQTDEEAQRLLEQFRAKQQALQESGFDQETMAELKEIKQEMANNETISEYEQAETAFLELLNETNDVISEKIGEEFARSTGGGCC
jgi:cell fate (sporulation/competence/biofilm development) regulator YlbF (YheA/YmcA/DUF963 family)